MNMNFLSSSAQSNGDDNYDPQGRPVQLFKIGTDLETLFVRTTKMKAAYLAQALLDSGIEYVAPPEPPVDPISPSNRWIISIVAPYEFVSPLFSIFVSQKLTAATIGSMLSSIFLRHQIRIRKYHRTRFVFQRGVMTHDLTEFNLGSSRTENGYRLPSDWL